MKKRPPANIMHGGPLVICKWYAGLYGLNGVWISSDLVMKTLWRCVKWSLWRQVCIRESVNSTSRNYNERCLKCEVGVMEWIYVFRSCNEDFVKSEVCEDKFEYLPSTKYVWECEYILRSCNEDASTADCPAIWGRCSTCHPLNISRVKIAAKRACHQKDKNTKIQFYEYNMKSMKHQRITV